MPKPRQPPNQVKISKTRLGKKNESFPVKKIFATLSIPALVLALSGCAGAASTESAYQALPSVCEAAPAGNNAKQIKLADESASKPEVKFPTPLNSDVTEIVQLKAGDGLEIKGGQLVDVDFIAYNGSNNEELQSSSFNGADPASLFVKSGETPDFCSALVGQKVGATVAVLFPPKDAHGGAGIPDFGLGAEDAMIFVLKISNAWLPRALGADQPAQAGFPTVIKSTDGIPGINTPSGDAPAELKVETLIQGTGDAIAEGDTAIVHYSGFLWSDGTKFDSSWDRGQPAEFEVASGSLIDGFVDALVGAKVGSQVVAVIPPQLGYGDQDNGSIPANSTLIFVVDVLGIRK